MVCCFLIIALFVECFILIKCTNKSSIDKSFVEKENDEEIVILVKNLIEDDESIIENKAEIDRIKFNENKSILLKLKRIILIILNFYLKQVVLRKNI